jgi:acetoin utilization protein AcuB
VQRINIRERMTAGPITIAPGESVAHALKVMQDRGVRHLPVVDEDKLVGIVSERELMIIENMDSVDSAHVLVRDALIAAPFTAAPDEPLGEVARKMAKGRYGSAVILEDDKVVGVFTTVDALETLADVLGAA